MEQSKNGTMRVVGAIHLSHRDELRERTDVISAMNVRIARRIARVTNGEYRPCICATQGEIENRKSKFEIRN
ncbi:MAG: hypothetical protein WC824_05185 [Bacteroidota bacterium]|jgi:hypothetical protein